MYHLAFRWPCMLILLLEKFCLINKCLDIIFRSMKAISFRFVMFFFFKTCFFVKCRTGEIEEEAVAHEGNKAARAIFLKNGLEIYPRIAKKFRIQRFWENKSINWSWLFRNSVQVVWPCWHWSSWSLNCFGDSSLLEIGTGRVEGSCRHTELGIWFGFMILDI